MLTIVGVLFYQNTVSLQEAIAAQKRSQDVVSRADETVALAFASYTAVDNFVEGGTTTYLAPFERARPKIRQNVDRLRLSAANPAQAEEVARLDQISRQFVEGAAARADLRKSKGTDFPVEENSWREGQNLLEQMQASANRIKKIEIEVQQAGDLQSDSDFARTVWILIVSSLAGIVSLGLANLTVLSEIKKRKAVQDELIEVNEGLERNVEDRTAELKRANEKLLEVGLERESILYSEKDARQEAEIANRLRDEFMATVSHELRTPLNSILGWARLMKGGSLDSSQSEKALATIIKNSETQNRLIEDLMDVARVISGKLQLELVELELGEVVSEAIETVRPAADAKHIRIEFEPAGREAKIAGDRNRLLQVFTNLLGNGLKFSPDSSVIYVSMDIEDASAVTRIRDQGKGISAAFLPLVFERFRQDMKNNSNNGGLGLGLAIVRNLAEMHGGSVKAESEGENRGSTFTVTLPTVPPARPELEPLEP